jgi:hypothetical protein
MKTRKAVAALAVVSVGLLAACGGDDDDSASEPADEPAAEEPAAEPAEEPAAEPAEEPAAEPAEEPAAEEPAGEAICPSELTIQTDWFPELEHGGTYQLIGPDGTADKTTVTYSGPVQEQYAVGGLETITIKTVNFDKANASTLLDGDADMAYIGMGDIIKDSIAVPMVAVAKTLHKDPQMIMWDPSVHDITEPTDIAATGAKVRHFPGAAYIDYMLAEGIMTADQDDPNYDGSDAEWVALGGDYFQQGFATNEVYKYENEIQWKEGAPAPVDFFTVGELGYDNYPATITLTQTRAAELDACLTELVPKMQQAWLDFFADPEPIMNRMIEINVEHDGFWALSPEVNAAGFELLMSGGFADNSEDGTYCSFEPARVQELFDILKPIYEGQGTEIAESVDGLYTNKYCEGAPGR